MRKGLVERAQGGDDVAFTALVDLDGDRCYAIAYRILRDVERAQDAVQQAFLLAWRELPKLRDPDRFEVWFHRLLVRACCAEARRSRRSSSRIRVRSLDGQGPDDASAAGRGTDRLELAFAALSPEHRAVLVLHVYVGLPVAEIAEVVGASPAWVVSRLHHATSATRAVVAVNAMVDAREAGTA